MLDLIQEAFQYGFMQKAMIVGVLIAVSSSVLGIFLVLRKMSRANLRPSFLSNF